MAEEKKKQLQAVDLVGIGSLLEDLIAKDMTSKQRKSGSTFAHPMIACEFAPWLVLSLKYYCRSCH